MLRGPSQAFKAMLRAVRVVLANGSLAEARDLHKMLTKAISRWAGLGRCWGRLFLKLTVCSGASTYIASNSVGICMCAKLTNMEMQAYMYTGVYTCRCIHICLYMYTYMYTCIYLYLYICIHIPILHAYIHTYLSCHEGADTPVL